MATLTIKSFPDELYNKLKDAAHRHRRSINSEAIFTLEHALLEHRIDTGHLLLKARELRKLTQHYKLTEKELSEAKKEGRP